MALAGGLYGASITDDGAEKLIYTVFQTIGIASVGYGGYTWQIGGEERSLHETLSLATSLSDKEKTQVLRAYYYKKKDREQKERFIKAITHGLIAAVNIYNASQQDEKSKGVRNALYFIGGVNTMAAISYTFEF